MRESTQINRFPALHRQIGCEFMNLVSRSRQSHLVGHYWTEHLKCTVNGARGDRLQQLRGGFSRSPWQPFDSIPNGTCKKIAVVAAEQFVTTIAGKAHRHAGSGEFGNQVSRYLRRIGEWLVIHGRQHKHNVEGIFWRYVKLGMLSPEMSGNFFCVHR